MKIRNLILAISLIVGLTASAIDHEELARAVAQINAGMPQPMGTMGTITSATASGDTLIYNLKLDGLGNLPLEYRKSDKAQKKFMLDNIAVMSRLIPDTAASFRLFASENVFIKYIITNPQSQTTAVVVITPADISEADAIKPDYKALTDYNIASAQKSLPIEMGGMKIVEISIRGNDIVTTAMVDEEIASIDDLTNNIGNIKNYYLSLIANGSDIMTMIQSYIMAKAGYSQMFLYKGATTGKTASYSIDPADVVAILEK